VAKRPPGAQIPVLKVRGTHAELGRQMGEFRAPQIRNVIAAAKASLWDADVTRDELAQQIAPYVQIAAREYPQYLAELHAMAEGADVPFEVLFRLNCYESRPPGTPPGSIAGPIRPIPDEAPTNVPVKDPGTLAEPDDVAPNGAATVGDAIGARGGSTNGTDGLGSVNGAATVEAQQAVTGHTPDGCTSVVSRSQGTVVLGHTEDSSPEAVDGIYLLDVEIEEKGYPRERFLALDYAQTLPGCAAAVNEHGLFILIDALPDPDHNLGVPRHMVSRALLACKSIEDALTLLRETERGGGWNYLLVQGDRYANVETTATRVVVTESDAPTYAHSNHYLDGQIAEAAGDPRPNSLARLERAQALVQPNLTTDGMKALLADRQGFPDSICRDRTIAAMVADAASRTVDVCWGEPEAATWTRFAI
jgi:predicted choloylglycine hydrolase